jgi:uncharacterized protein with HEPN domain
VLPRDWRFRLEDICDSLERIEEYVKGHDRDTWKADRKTFDAVVRNLEIIGEAAARIPDNIQDLNQQIPWYKMKALRNILVHEYFGVDEEIIWKTEQEDLPDLKKKMKKIVSGI